MKRYTGIEIMKISNGWLVDCTWEKKEEGKEESEWGEDRIYCQTEEAVMEEVKKGIGLLG